MSTVVIVGRKNVGKSTVFNRLTGTRRSLVYREPGITRDRVYGQVEWNNHRFNIIDTGGFFPEEEDTLSEKIEKQIEAALQEANLIYFVVDAKVGLLPEDIDICNRLRKWGKPIFLLLNKFDTKVAQTNQPEFCQLGIDKTFPVSAEHGLGFDELLEKTIQSLPVPEKAKFVQPVIRLLILGRPNVGKSTLLNAILNKERSIVHNKPGTTRDIINEKFVYQERLLEIIDTGGIRRRTRIKTPPEFYSALRALKTIDWADVVILLFDATQGVVNQDRRIASLILSRAKGIILVPNKLDLFKKNDRKKILNSTYRSFPFLDFAPIVPISAKYNQGIKNLLDTVLHIYDELKKRVDKKTLKELPQNLKPPTSGELIALHQIGTQPPVFRATLTCRVKEDYIRYLRNSIRSYFGFKGVPILFKTEVRKR